MPGTRVWQPFSEQAWHSSLTLIPTEGKRAECSSLQVAKQAQEVTGVKEVTGTGVTEVKAGIVSAQLPLQCFRSAALKGGHSDAQHSKSLPGAVRTSEGDMSHPAALPRATKAPRSFL
eukprot:1161915-Pelagomonas_calceolata.AAC.2